MTPQSSNVAARSGRNGNPDESLGTDPALPRMVASSARALIGFAASL